MKRSRRNHTFLYVQFQELHLAVVVAAMQGADQQQFAVQYLAQGHFNMQIRGFKPATFQLQDTGFTPEPQLPSESHLQGLRHRCVTPKHPTVGFICCFLQQQLTGWRMHRRLNERNGGWKINEQFHIN